MNNNSGYYRYAHLGETCKTDFSALVSNTKYFPMNAPVYSVFPTVMQHYPARTHNIKTQEYEEQDRKGVVEKETYVRPKCCGNF